MLEKRFRLLIRCPDKVGIVSAVSAFISDRGGWLLEANYHADQSAGQFFMRHDIKADQMQISIEAFKREFEALAQAFDMTWWVTDASQPKKVVIFASLASHCLVDLLHKKVSGDLNCEIVAVISNHDKLRKHVEWSGIDFHHIPFSSESKDKSYTQIEEFLSQYQVDLLVLARFMQIIPEHLCDQYKNRIINIHHSFLPSFIGANPYQKAYDRGVKLIGATSHYVTTQLDEGPIIEQDVIRVSHRDNKDDMVRLGKDVEVQVLSRGVRYHLEDRILTYGNKTVILE
ncbi:MAG: formyltetrahydrofolate deformylase [Cellvibrionales bacterium]|nr:formyltetrahydrofolate deformylase [Cellvibrionales bacterium]